MNGAIAVVGLTAAMAGGTWLFGWWAIIVIGLIWGSVREPRHAPGLMAAWGAGFAWGALLYWMARQGPVGAMADLVGEITGLPASGVTAVTILFAAVLAGSAATVASDLVQRFRPKNTAADGPDVTPSSE